MVSCCVGFFECIFISSPLLLKINCHFLDMHDNRPLQVLPAFYKRFEYIVLTLECFMDLDRHLDEQGRKPLRSVV